jgi:hypothetical protein
MPHLASTARAVPAGANAAQAGDERLDLPQSAMIVLTLSLTSWTGVAFLVRWAIG